MLQDAPMISVCIANYNGEQVIADCVNSILMQQGAISFEIVIHDDASTDNSLALLNQSYPSDQYSNIRIIESQQNVGFCIANNRMAAIARGQYLLLLNNDAVLFPDALKVLLQEANRLTIPAILSLPQYDFESGKLIDCGSLLDLFCNPVPNQKLFDHDMAMVIGACLWIPKLFWQVLEGFPEWFSSLGEDLYLCCQARVQGNPVRVLGRSGYRHWVGASFGGGKVQKGKLSTNRKRRALSERNKTFTLILCYPSPWMQLILPLHLGLLIIEGFLISILKFDLGLWRNIYWYCLREIWSKRRVLQDHRRLLQSKRRVSSADFFAPHTVFPHKLRMLFKYGLPRIK